MKSICIGLLFASVIAVKLQDAPPYFDEPTWHQTWPSATGLVQTSVEDAPPYFNEPTWHQTWPSATGLV